MLDDSFRPLAVILAGCLASLAPGHADAALFCVDDDNELRIASGQVSKNAESDEIRITAGIKQSLGAGDEAWHFYANDNFDLAISGGWNDSCSSQDLDPRSTVLNGVGSKSILSLWLDGASAAEVRISNLSFEHGIASTSAKAAAVSVYASDTAAPVVIIERIVARLNDATSPTSAPVVLFKPTGSATGLYTLRNSMIEANTARALDVSLVAGAVAHINNNTIVANQPPSTSAALVSIGSGGTVWMANNVVADNIADSDVAIAAGSVSFLRSNHIGTLVGAAGSNQGTSTGPALLAVDADGWWRPLPDSPLRDSGHSAPNGGFGSNDVANGARVQGPRVDRGAIETDGDVLFVNGFEPLP